MKDKRKVIVTVNELMEGIEAIGNKPWLRTALISHITYLTGENHLEVAYLVDQLIIWQH